MALSEILQVSVLETEARHQLKLLSQMIERGFLMENMDTVCFYSL